MQNQRLKKIYRTVAITILVLLLIGLALWNRIIIRVPSGHVGVLYHVLQGTQTDYVYPEGHKAIFPLHRMFIYNARKQVIEQRMNVISKDGLTIAVTVVTRFRPVRDSLAVIHKNLGIDYVDVVLKPEIESATRKIISRYDPEGLYTLNRAEIEDEITADCEDEFGRDDIVVDDIMIKTITLPPVVAKAIELKLEEEQKNLAYDYTLLKEKKEAQRKLIEANGIRNFTDSSGISILIWRGIEATLELAKSTNSKVIIIGNDSKSLPIILNADSENN